jgi:AraC family transcriptional regulator
MILCSDRPILHRRARPNDVNVLAQCNQRTRPIGDLIFLPPGTALTTITQTSERASAVTCLFDPEWFAATTELPREWTMGDLTQCIDLKNGRLDQAMRWLERELNSPSFGTPLVLESISNMLAIELKRHLWRGSVPRLRTTSGRIPRTQIDRIYDLVEAAENRFPTVGELAELCGTSAVHLRRSFRATTNQTLNEFIEQARFQKAARLLVQTDLPLKAVAYRVGFSSAANFATAFKRHQGETPTAYRIRRQ